MVRSLRGFGLPARPRHESFCLATVPSTGTVLIETATSNDGAGTLWQRLQFSDRHGWAPREYVKIAD